MPPSETSKSCDYRGQGRDGGRSTAAHSAGRASRQLARTMGPIRVLVVDDHETFLNGLRIFLRTQSDLLLCGEAKNGRDAIEKAKQLQPDVILMDITMDGIDGLEATRVIRKEVAKARVIIVSQHEFAHMYSEAMSAGASAYVTKTQVSTCLIPAIEATMRDGPLRVAAKRG
jgi:DNA-binding NarL/FixJ family response regulator